MLMHQTLHYALHMHFCSADQQCKQPCLDCCSIATAQTNMPAVCAAEDAVEHGCAEQLQRQQQLPPGGPQQPAVHQPGQQQPSSCTGYGSIPATECK